MLLLDTTAVSEVMRRKPSHLERLRSFEPREILLCAPVAAEIRFGLERLDPASRRWQLLDQEYRRLRNCVSWADWTENAAEIFGNFKAELQRKGTPVDDMDLVIASIAASCDATVATANISHFSRIPGLDVSDWS